MFGSGRWALEESGSAAGEVVVERAHSAGGLSAVREVERRGSAPPHLCCEPGGFAAAELAAPAGVTVDAALGVSASEALLASVASLLVTNAAPASDEAVYVHADLASGGTTSATISPAPATAAFTSALSAGYVQAGNPLAICEPRRRPRTDARRATIHGVATSACQRREMRARCTSSCGVTLHLLLWCFI